MRKINKRYLLARAIIVILLIVTVSGIYISNTQDAAKERGFTMLAEVSDQGGARLHLEVDKCTTKLRIIADLIEREPTVTPDSMLQHLQPLVSEYGFVRIGIADTDGNVKTTDGESFNISDRVYFNEALQGSAAVSDAMNDKVNGARILVYAVPIFDNGTVIGVLFSTYSAVNYTDALSTSSFSGEGFSYIVKRNGDCVVGTSHADSIGMDFDNLFRVYGSYSSKNSDAVAKMQTAMASDESGGVSIYYIKDKFCYYQPLGINDWYLVTLVPSSIVMSETVQALIWSYIFVAICVLIVVVLVIDGLHTRLDSYRQLERAAYVDELTGGDSYNKFKLDTERLLKDPPEGKFAMISLDVDNFQYINDVYGYDEGDSALRFLWQVLKNTLLPFEACARVYGDHFVYLAHYRELSELERRFKEVTHALHEYHPAGSSALGYNFAVSAGVYPIDFSLTDVDTIVNRARIPQKRIKGLASSGLSFYTDKLHKELINNKSLENLFPLALANNEFLVYYQPKYDLKKESYCGAEALVRWQSPSSLLSPGVFIPVFERNGDIVQLDLHMLEMVCADLRRWLDAGLPVSPISVNVSHLQLLHADFVSVYTSVLRRFDIPPQLIEMEFTETIMVQNAARLTRAAEELHENKFRVLMDDFGSGYSSLGMLKNVPLDVLKLDRSFVIDLERDKKARDVVIGALALAHTLDMTVTAEGVETAAQFEFLKSAGCDAIQGFYCARPMPAKDYENILSGKTSFTPEK